MKKFIRIVLIIITIISATFILPSCNFDFGNLLQEAVENAVWSYSETGEAEINLNFEALKSNNYKGKYTWTVTINRDGTSTTYDITNYADKTAETQKQKFVYKQGTTELAKLILGEETHHIDITNKAVYSENNETFTPMVLPTFYALKYGIITLKEDEVNKWTFVSKTDDVSVTNSQGQTESTIEYLYTSVEEPTSTSSTKMLVDFKKVITPMLARIYYEVYNNNTLTETITIYNNMHTGVEITEADFAIPTVADGYTVVE